MSAVAAPPVTTLEAWAALDEDDSRELVDGRLEDDEVPSAVHETVVRWLLVMLDAYLRPRGGFVFGSGMKLAVRARSGRVPDVVAYGPGKRPEARGLVKVPPDVVVEVVSPSPRDERRDRIQKPDDYAAFGVRYYWIVDPDYRSFEIWELGGDGRYVRAATGIAGKVERVPGLDGLIVDLDALWAEVDRLEAP
ncbi:MAG TPA: Uma2 family endonuclease [Polyangiaceae bacterium]|nr:Uma2 family endonuclease [Polyangiaceae bacterium]